MIVTIRKFEREDIPKKVEWINKVVSARIGNFDILQTVVSVLNSPAIKNFNVPSIVLRISRDKTISEFSKASYDNTVIYIFPSSIIIHDLAILEV